MNRLQAVILSCIPEEWDGFLKSYIDNNLNLYSFEIIKQSEIINSIYTDGAEREILFSKIDSLLSDAKTEKIIIFSSPEICGMHKLDFYESDKQPENQHELFLRHIVSILRARYKNNQIEVFTTEPLEKTFKQVI